MSIEQMQTTYLNVVGRCTGSDNRRYLVWKIREAEKGRVHVGSRKDEPLDVKILALRLERELADRMDQVWLTRGASKAEPPFSVQRLARALRSSAPEMSRTSSRTPCPRCRVAE